MNRFTSPHARGRATVKDLTFAAPDPVSKDTGLMARRVLPLAISAVMALAISSTPDGAHAQDACSVYTTRAGDSLGTIAEAAYGAFDYQQIFHANRNEIVNPNAIEAGLVLKLPCADGSLPGAAPADPIVRPVPARADTVIRPSSQFEPPIRIVSANGWAPFVGEDLAGGGMLVRIATTALNRGGNSRDYSVNYVDDWSSHLQTLLPLGAFDVSVAWYMPDCLRTDAMSEAMKSRCTELDSTVPVYEAEVGFFTLPGNAYESARVPADLAGARICRPKGRFTFDLEAEGLAEPVVTMAIPDTVTDCLELMQAGKADVVSLEVESVVAAARELGLEDRLVRNPHLTKVLGMSFVTHKTNPRGRVYIAMLNRGLAEMRQSGELSAIVSESLAEFSDPSD